MIRKLINSFNLQVEISLAYHIIANKWLDHEKCSLSETEVYKIPLLTIYVTKKSGYKDVFKQKYGFKYERKLLIISVFREVSYFVNT